jgi:hypothetical protein
LILAIRTHVYQQDRPTKTQSITVIRRSAFLEGVVCRKQTRQRFREPAFSLNSEKKSAGARNVSTCLFFFANDGADQDRIINALKPEFQKTRLY